MSLQYRKPLLVTAATLILGAAAWYSASKISETASESNRPAPQVSESSHPDLSLPATTSVSQGGTRLQSQKLVEPSEFTAEDGKRLYQARGLDSQQRAIYWGYPLESLRQLSANNDAYATLALANKLATKAPFTEAEWQEMDHSQMHRAFIEQNYQILNLKKLAAAQGSVEAINEMFYDMYGQHYAFGESSESDHPDLLRELYGLQDPAVPIEWELSMNAAAWAVVQGRRGDPLHSLINLEALNKGFALNESNWSDVLSRADDIFAELVVQRQALGLAPFDNRIVEGYRGDFKVRSNEYYAWLLSNDTVPDLIDYYTHFGAYP